MLAIKSKLINQAEDFLITRPDLENWDQIKTNESIQVYILKLKYVQKLLVMQLELF